MPFDFLILLAPITVPFAIWIGVSQLREDRRKKAARRDPGSVKR